MRYVFVYKHVVGFEPYLFDLRVNLEGKEPYAYPRPLAMVDPNIGANKQEWREDLVTSCEEVQIHSSNADGSTPRRSGTPHSSGGLELASLDENMSLESRLPTWREH